MSYCERIRSLREANNYTQEFISNILCVCQKTYSDYEIGKTRIPVSSLIELARLYNVSMDYIVGISSVRGVFPCK